MEKPIVVITGASSGFGLLAAIEFFRKGYHVVATMRNLHNKEKFLNQINDQGNKGHIQFVRVDVTDKQSLEDLKGAISSIGGIDILINNAGYAAGGFAEEVSQIEYKEQFETNFFGSIEVTKIVLPFMRKQQRGKIFNISSISGQIGFPGLSPYVASKFALEGWSESLRLEVKPFGIDVALIEPGSFQTNIWSTGKKIAEKSLLPSSPYYELMEKIDSKLEKDKSKHGDPLEVVKLLVILAHKPRLHKLRYPVGKGVKIGILLKKFIPWRLWETIILQSLGMHKK